MHTSQLQGMFSHFVDALNQTCQVVALSSATDYRCADREEEGRERFERLLVWEHLSRTVHHFHPLHPLFAHRVQMLHQGRQQQQQHTQTPAVVSSSGVSELALSQVYASPLGPASEQHLSGLWAKVTQVREWSALCNILWMRDSVFALKYEHV